MAEKEEEIAGFLASVSQMSKGEKQTCMLTCLSLLWKPKSQATDSNKKTRVRFQYRVPVVGDVCRIAFTQCFGVSTPTLERYRLCIARGEFAAKTHGNNQNHNAVTINVKKVVDWFEDFAKQVGEVVPVRVRQKITENGTAKRQVSATMYTFLPSYMTWQSILSEYKKFVAAGWERILVPSERSFRRILQRECQTIQVRSPQANVCDACTIYKNTISDAQDAEVFALHVQSARQMRHAYNEDCSNVSESHVVLTMDFSQNLTLPNAA
ncbi:hypothetical protein AeNC1_018791, partial [Aphanomyces euteiches]